MMKSLLSALAIFAAMSPAFASEPAAATDTAFPGTDEELAWDKVTEEVKDLSEVEAAQAAYRKRVIKAYTEFIETFPDDEKAQTALLRRAVYRLLDAQTADSEHRAAEVLAELRELRDNPKAKEENRQQAGGIILQRRIAEGTPEEAKAALMEYQTLFPGRELSPSLAASIAEKLRDTDPEFSEKLRKTAEQQAAEIEKSREDAEKRRASYVNTPVDLKFTALDGTDVDLSKMRGKVVLIDFWATWCGPCIKSMPRVKALYEKYHDQGLEVVGISLDTEERDVRKFLAKNDLPWPQFFDGDAWDAKVVKKLGITAIPAIWIIDRSGVIVDNEGHGENLESKVDAFFKKQ